MVYESIEHRQNMKWIQNCSSYAWSKEAAIDRGGEENEDWAAVLGKQDTIMSSYYLGSRGCLVKGSCNDYAEP